LAELKANKKGDGMDSVYTLTKEYTDGAKYKEVKTVTLTNGIAKLGDDGKPKIDTKKILSINNTDKWTLIWLVFLQVLFVTMVYGPVAAFLVELFPAKIRYTSMSLPYHIGNGIFGGLLPAVATFLALNAKKANEIAEAAGLAKVYDKPYLEGLWYPIAVAGVCLIIGVIYLDGSDNRIDD
jgi:hypothetical protein